jgi:hypothetical protein
LPGLLEKIKVAGLVARESVVGVERFGLKHNIGGVRIADGGEIFRAQKIRDPTRMFNCSGLS